MWLIPALSGACQPSSVRHGFAFRAKIFALCPLFQGGRPPGVPKTSDRIPNRLAGGQRTEQETNYENKSKAECDNEQHN